MKTRKLGNQGLEVSELDLGCMGMSFGSKALDRTNSGDYQNSSSHRKPRSCKTRIDEARSREDQSGFL